MTIFFEFLLYFVFIGLCRLLVGPGADDFPLNFSCILYLLAVVSYQLGLELMIFLLVSLVFCIYWPS